MGELPRRRSRRDVGCNAAPASHPAPATATKGGSNAALAPGGTRTALGAGLQMEISLRCPTADTAGKDNGLLRRAGASPPPSSRGARKLDRCEGSAPHGNAGPASSRLRLALRSGRRASGTTLLHPAEAATGGSRVTLVAGGATRTAGVNRGPTGSDGNDGRRFLFLGPGAPALEPREGSQGLPARHALCSEMERGLFVSGCALAPKASPATFSGGSRATLAAFTSGGSGGSSTVRLATTAAGDSVLHVFGVEGAPPSLHVLWASRCGVAARVADAGALGGRSSTARWTQGSARRSTVSGRLSGAFCRHCDTTPRTSSPYQSFGRGFGSRVAILITRAATFLPWKGGSSDKTS
mmetsp:Transcript_32430/g.89667  ORF Transcript_32430/g.89667 Transcript_32430/m.89667 type:complete len:353 (+) Transcript_32430:458-1516(+)